MKNKIIRFSVDHPKFITLTMVLSSVLLVLLALLPSVWPKKFTMLKPAAIDTDPENMLPANEPVRVFHRNMKKEFNLSDMIVVGVINDHDPDGVFNVESLRKIHALAAFAKTINWPDPKHPEQSAGVISVDLLAPSTVDNIEPGSNGSVRFEWLMPVPPKTSKQALAVRDKARRIPLLNGTLISDGDKGADGRPALPKALAMYIPLTDKHLSYKIAAKLQEEIARLGPGNEEFHITGLPVAEDTFGVEMFKQMAMTAPLAMLIIFMLMWYFFRKFSLIVSPMIVAVICVMQTMGLLVVSGNTIHIMSSMIPIFIMPIAVLDAIHILSEFFDRYQETRDRRTTILNVMDTLFTPMLYTSLTTAVGFASLALTPIPPVQVFGLFVAFGVMMAWIWTVTFVPASIMFIRQASLENFGLTQHNLESESHSPMTRLLGALGHFTFSRARTIIVITLVIAAIAGYGISRININDNPIKWFEPKHPIRIADRKLNQHFAGTYMAYLALEAAGQDNSPQAALDELTRELPGKLKELQEQDYTELKTASRALMQKAVSLAGSTSTRWEFLQNLEKFASAKADADNTPDDMADTWSELATYMGMLKLNSQTFKDPAVLNWIADLQQALLKVRNQHGRQLVGKSSSIADVVRTVYRELLGGDPKNYIVPRTMRGVADTLMQYQNSHRPQDLWHFVEKPDDTAGKVGFRKTSLWVQLKSGDNRDMVRVVQAIDKYIADNPPPRSLTHKWFGLTYINVIWQKKMVAGMLSAFMGSFLVVLFMMIVLFRSALWGILSMIPLCVTIGAIYGLIGLVGKDYDMPVAVLSSLSLGLAVDYAIHFLARSREMRAKTNNWENTVGPVFGEPARAITRNVLVVGVGFLPLLAAPLVPYQTVGVFIAAILITAGVASLFILPAIITLLEHKLFTSSENASIMCKCGTCTFAGIALVATVAINVHQFTAIGFTRLSWISAAVCVLLAGICFAASRRRECGN